jgi:hypothetical protein
MSNLTDKELLEECKKRFICFEECFINRDDIKFVVEDDKKELSVELFEEFKEYVEGYETSYLWEFLSDELKNMWINFKEYKKEEKE